MYHGHKARRFSRSVEHRKAMFANAGLRRSRTQLQNLLESLPAELELAWRVPLSRQSAENANLALLGSLVARCALERKESRGGHTRDDYPTMATNCHRDWESHPGS